MKSLLLAATLGALTLAASLPSAAHDFPADLHALKQFRDGRDVFRYATFGDEVFWGDTLGLDEAIAGQANGGVGPGVSPKLALSVGLKVDVESLPRAVIFALRRGKVNLDDPAVTL